MRIISFLLFVSCIVFFSQVVGASGIYQFEQKWPNLQEPWCFVDTEGIAIDSSGNITVRLFSIRDR